MVEGSGVPHHSDLLFGRLMWLIRIRWFALGGVFALVALFSYLDLLFQLTPLVTTLAVLILLNLFYHLLLRRRYISERPGIKAQCLAQILTDILGILSLSHFTGGLTNPFVFFLVAPIITAGIFFQPRWTYLLATLALGLTAVLGLLETGGALRVHPISIFRESENPDVLHQWMSIILLLLGALLFTSAYLVCQIVGTLRKREWHLARVQTMNILRNQDLDSAAEQRREALAGLARGIDRQIKDPLGVIRARVDSMRYDLEDLGQADGDLVKDLDVIAMKVEQIDKTLEKVSTLWGRSSGERKRVDLTRLLKTLIGARWDRILKQGIELRLAMAPDLPRIEGSPEELAFLFESILQNALEALEGVEKGRVLVQIRRLRDAAESVLVRIKDNGPGLPLENQRRLFDPFYSTRGGNRGMGLALAYIVVRNHNGSIRVRSKPPPGTSVVILLPATRSLADASP